MVGVSPIPQRDGWTVAELDALPDDGQRREIVDGMLLVNPPPKPGHQIGAFEIAKVLDAAAPDDLVVIPGPARVVLDVHTALEPDLSVWYRRDLVDNELLGVPLLVVEVLSPSTRSKDLVLKRDVYARIGIPSYWIFDQRDLSLLVLELQAESYAEIAHVTGDQGVTVNRPYPLTITPAALA